MDANVGAGRAGYVGRDLHVQKSRIARPDSSVSEQRYTGHGATDAGRDGCSRRDVPTHIDPASHSDNPTALNGRADSEATNAPRGQFTGGRDMTQGAHEGH
jgi:hypothetical protein